MVGHMWVGGRLGGGIHPVSAELTVHPASECEHRVAPPSPGMQTHSPLWNLGRLQGASVGPGESPMCLCGTWGESKVPL